MIIAIKDDKERLRLAQAAHDLEKKRRSARWKEVERWGRFLNTWGALLLYTAALLLLGAAIGHNVLSDVVLCRTKCSPCDVLRILPGKVVVPSRKHGQTN